MPQDPSQPSSASPACSANAASGDSIDRPWDELQADFSFLHSDQMASVSLGPEFASEDETERFALAASLPRYLVADGQAGPDGHGRAVVALGDVLGKGGMGVVNVGEQLSLKRSVAVKRPRPDAASARAQQQLIREAVVTGALDHPNIVPVYDLARDEGDRPLLLMKRVEGRTWEQLLAERPEPDDPHWQQWLEGQLETLIQVCNAVSFAHSRGILHRDLKPDNVMLGHFGEVYVVDWGVAVSTRAADGHRFPLAADSHHIAGTPAYMAPELVCADAKALNERTDVYLLGAILHEILAGAPPHDSDSALTSLYHAFESPPAEFDATIPTAIADICRQAMAREPAQRYGSAAELREAIRAYLSSRASLHLTETGLALLERLRAMAGAEVPDAYGATLGGDSEPMRLFTESRFAFRQALAVWPDNAEATAGLLQVVTLGVQSAVQTGDLRTARLLMADLPEPSPELETAISQLATRQHEERNRLRLLEALGADYDVTAGWRSRRILAGALVLVWTIEPIAVGLARFTGAYTPTMQGQHIAALALLLIVAIAGLAARKSWAATAVNRSLYVVAVGLAVATATNRLIMDGSGLSLAQSLAADIVLYAMAAVGAAAAIADPRLLISAAIYLCAALCVWSWPELAHIINGIANFFAIGLLVVLWRPAAQRKAIAARKTGTPYPGPPAP